MVTTKRHARVAAVAIAIVLVLGIAVAVARTSRRPASETERPDPSVRPPATAAPTRPSPRPSPRPTTPPPGDSVRLPDRYLATYGAKRVSWDALVSRGRTLPPVSRRCAERWRSSGKDARLNWKSGDFLCLDELGGSGYRPQGIGGSATALDYSIGRAPAASRNLVLTSWYSRKHVRGLFAPNRPGESVTRLVVIDLDRRRYNTVELVKPDGGHRLRNLNSHGSGLVWAGQYLYSSSHSKLWMYNADDLVEISGRFVLPAVARWTGHGRGGLSSISLDRSAKPHQLRAINYSRKGQAYVSSFPLAANGLLRSNDTGSARSLRLENQFGESGRVVHSTRSMRIPGTNYQGVASAGRYTFANSSGLRTQDRPDVGLDAANVLKDGKVLDAVRMPGGNVESVYIDYRRGLYLSLVEHGSQFLFAIPLRQLITIAER